jgi:hypothetical protein
MGDPPVPFCPSHCAAKTLDSRIPFMIRDRHLTM